MQAVTDGLDELPAVPPAVRRQLLAELAANRPTPSWPSWPPPTPWPTPASTSKTHQRVVRALEIVREHGAAVFQLPPGPGGASGRRGRPPLAGRESGPQPRPAKNYTSASTSAC
ncbi:MAG: hypothetical protein WKG07_42265 [Hymenobacter sp.]